MNNKGFTLIELLASIMLLSVVMSITAVTVISIMNNSKEKSYDILIKNIKIAAIDYYQECSNDDVIETTISCSDSSTINITVMDLVDYGFLTNASEIKSGDSVTKHIYDPRNNNDISDCVITISYSDGNYIITGSGEECPTDY